MTEQLKDKIAKIYELVNRGATEGEKAAAKNALDRVMRKYHIDEEQLKDLGSKQYVFKYTTQLELWLLNRILHLMIDDGIKKSIYRPWHKQFISTLSHEEWVVVECSYEYFRRHMKQQWKKLCGPELAKCRKAKTRNKRRLELYDFFFSQYCIKSKLYKEDELYEIKPTSQGEMRDRRMMNGVEGGNYNKQVVGNLLLEN